MGESRARREAERKRLRVPIIAQHPLDIADVREALLYDMCGGRAKSFAGPNEVKFGSFESDIRRSDDPLPSCSLGPHVIAELIGTASD